MTPTEFKESTLKELKTYILGLIRYESTIDDKLNLLTEIGLTSSNEQTFKACEEIRSEICEAERSDVNADSKKRANSGVASKRKGKKTGDILHPEHGPSLHDGNGLKKKLEAILSTINLKKQKTFEFEGTEFSTSLVKSFLKECKNLPDLKIEVLYDSMFFTWANGSAKINAYPIAENIKAEIKKEQEMLK